jgi:hypothetical protein
MDFMIIEMDVCHQIPLNLGRLFLSTAGATIDVAAGIIKLNNSRKEEAFTFKLKGTKQYNQVMVTIRPEWNCMTPDMNPVLPRNFQRNFLDVSRMSRLLRQVLQMHRQPKSLGMKTVLLIDLKCDALIERINQYLSHISFSSLLPPIAFLSPFHPPFLFTPFPQHVYFIIA